VPGTPPRPVALGAVVTAVLLLVLVGLALADRWIRQGRAGAATGCLFAAAAGFAASVLLVIADLARVPDKWASNATGSADWALMGAWILLAAVSACLAIGTGVYAKLGFFSRGRFDGITVTFWVGGFTVVAWLLVAISVYGGPRLL